MPRKVWKSNTDLYKRCNEIIRDAGHDDPESLQPKARFDLVLSYVMKKPKPIGKIK